MSDPVSMAAGPARFSPRPGLVIEDRGPAGQIALRGDLADPRIVAAVDRLAAAPVPGPLTVQRGQGGARVVWMSPDELLIVTGDRAAVPAMLSEARAALAEVHHLLLDMSDARTLLHLAGPDVAETLAKGAPVDLSAAGFPVGTARRTHLAQIAAVFWRLEPEAWEIACLRSYGHHMAAWLATAGGAGAEVGGFAQG